MSATTCSRPDPAALIERAIRDGESALRTMSHGEIADLVLSDLRAAGYVLGVEDAAAESSIAISAAIVTGRWPADDHDGTSPAELVIRALKSAGFRIVRGAT